MDNSTSIYVVVLTNIDTQAGSDVALVPTRESGLILIRRQLLESEQVEDPDDPNLQRVIDEVNADGSSRIGDWLVSIEEPFHIDQALTVSAGHGRPRRKGGAR